MHLLVEIDGKQCVFVTRHRIEREHRVAARNFSRGDADLSSIFQRREVIVAAQLQKHTLDVDCGSFGFAEINMCLVQFASSS